MSADSSQITDFSSISLFENIKEADLRIMLPCLKHSIREYKKKDVILMEEEDVHYAGIVLSGRVNMIKEDFWGNSSLYTFFHAGELFGETYAVRKNRKSNVTFIAASDAKILFLSLFHIIHPCPKGCPFHVRLSENLYDELGQKNIRMMEKIEMLSKGSLRGKILACLSEWAQDQDSSRIKPPLNRTEMADYLGANRSAMTRELSLMRSEGLIDFDRNTFVLKRPE